MNKWKDKKQDRREFLKTWGRNATLGTLLLIGGGLSMRKPKQEDIDHTCVNRGICRGCKAYNGCSLPQAQSAKAVQKKESMQ